MESSGARKASLGIVATALLALVFADLEIAAIDPWTEMGRLAIGLVTPDFFAIERLGAALLQTVAFAFLGVGLGAAAGFGLALAFRRRTIRVMCAALRSVHELAWAIVFLQAFGLAPITGVFAIALPYAGIFAKVYSEILEEHEGAALKVAPEGASGLSVFFFIRLPDVWEHVKGYTLYRLECGLRSSAVLGFIGLPTLGFHLQAAFKQGHNSEVSALLLLFYVLIATIRWWARPRLIWLYILASIFVLPNEPMLSLDSLVRFVTEDIVPQPLRAGSAMENATWLALAGWAWHILADQAMPGIVATLVLTQIALAVTGFLALVFYPLVSRKFFGPVGRTAGHVFLVVTRSTPEYMLAYILLQLWGPSMLPALVALSLHNAAIIGHLLGRQANQLALRPDAPSGLNLYAFETTPRLYGQFLAFLFYRWEIILRETAILGMLGVFTLGFYLDSAFAELRFDRALFLIVIIALLNIAIDAFSRFIRARLRLSQAPEVS